MVHNYNTWGKKQELVVKMNQDSQMKDMKINSLKDENLNLKEIIIKNLQNENEELWQKCEQLERICTKYESDHNALAKYGHQII